MSKLIDEETLSSLRDLQSEEDPHFLKNYFNLFLQPLPQLIGAIEKSISEKDYAELAMSAHAIKSSSANSGVLLVSALCAELEKMGHAKSSEGAAEKLATLKKYIFDVEVEIRALPEFKS